MTVDEQNEKVIDDYFLEMLFLDCEEQSQSKSLHIGLLQIWESKPTQLTSDVHFDKIMEPE